MFYLLKKEKNTVSSLPKALLTVKFQSQDLITDFCIMPLQSSLFSSSRAELNNHKGSFASY